jgi:hypothetical protein
VLGTFIPVSFVEAPEFLELMEVAEPQFKVPGRTTIRKDVKLLKIKDAFI